MNITIKLPAVGEYLTKHSNLITVVRIRLLALKLKINNMTKRGGARIAGEGKKIGRPKKEPTKVVRIKVSELEKLRADGIR